MIVTAPTKDEEDLKELEKEISVSLDKVLLLAEAEADPEQVKRRLLQTGRFERFVVQGKDTDGSLEKAAEGVGEAIDAL